jgi:hypothetical protein
MFEIVKSHGLELTATGTRSIDAKLLNDLADAANADEMKRGTGHWYWVRRMGS